MTSFAGRVSAALRAGNQPVPTGSLVAFRVVVGGLVALGAARFLAYGWVDRFFVKPTFFFKYWGFEWVTVAPPAVMHGAFVALMVLGIAIAVGLYYRAATVLTFLLFTYVELIDVTNYLNHYVLLSLLLLWMSVLPLHRAGSIDARRKPALRTMTFPAWMIWALRVQVGLVYIFAAVAKMGPDWLLHGQPLGIWLASRSDTPILGPLFELPYAPLAMAWAGFLHDLLVVPALLWKRTRGYAYGALVVFHLLTGVLFTIGLFPWIMIAGATIFLDPQWPRNLVRRIRVAATNHGPPIRVTDALPRDRSALPLPLNRVGLAAIATIAVLQIAIPLRALAYPGTVLWHEQGMRFAWKVMVREKNGSISYRVRVPKTGREFYVAPSRYLTDYQEREMSGQPDLILQLAHRIRDDHRHLGPVEVRVDAPVSLNGRPMAPLVDPQVDLARIDDGLGRAPWILPPPDTAPHRASRPFLAHQEPEL